MTMNTQAKDMGNTVNRTLLINTYLDYVNNYLTVQSFANAYGLHYAEAVALINLGRSCFRFKHPEA